MSQTVTEAEAAMLGSGALSEDRLASEAKGRLRLFVGLCPGAGKTHRMLQCAVEHVKLGKRVLAVAVDPSATDGDSLLEGVQRLSSGASAKGKAPPIDLSEVQRIHPDLALIDDLAALSGSSFRWAAAHKILEMGIDVYGTLDIYQIESLIDDVRAVVPYDGVDPIPDRFVESADSLEIVDAPNDALIERFATGRARISDVESPLASKLYTAKTLNVLRELTLQHLCDLSKKRSGKGGEHLSGLTPKRDTIMVCVGPDRNAAKMIRTAKRIADCGNSHLIAVYVKDVATNEAARQFAEDALLIAERLGAETVTLSGRDRVVEILNYARTRGASLLIASRAPAPAWTGWFRKAFVDELVKASDTIDVRVVVGDPEPLDPPRWLVLFAKMTPVSSLLAILVPLFATLIGLVGEKLLGDQSIVLIYMLGAAFIASRFSATEAALSTVISIGLFDLYFINSGAGFSIADPKLLVTALVMLVVSLIISSLTLELRAQASTATERALRMIVLTELGRKLLQCRSEEEIGRVICKSVGEVIQCEAALLIPDRNGALVAKPPTQSGFEEEPTERSVSRIAFSAEKACGLGTEFMQQVKAIYLPVVASQGCTGILAIRPFDGRRLTVSELQTIETFINKVAISLERVRAEEQMHEASLRVEIEQIRSALLSSVSHDLRTPLTVISGNAENLGATQIDDETRRTLADNILFESKRLNSQITNLLDMTRLHSEAIAVRKDWNSLEELLQSAVQRVKPLLKNRKLQVKTPVDLSLLYADASLVEQVLVNLLENATKYTPDGCNIFIEAYDNEDKVIVSVADSGAGIPKEEVERVFEKFYQTHGSSKKDGFGLGLAICQAIMKLHQGRIEVRNGHEGGAVFTLEFPRLSFDDGGTHVE